MEHTFEMGHILEIEEEYADIYIFYELNNDSNNVIWYYDDMPDYLGWIGRFSTFPVEKDELGKIFIRETLYPRKEKFYCDANFKEESINYLNNYFNELLHNKTIIRFILNDTPKLPVNL